MNAEAPQINGFSALIETPQHFVDAPTKPLYATAKSAGPPYFGSAKSTVIEKFVLTIFVMTLVFKFLIFQPKIAFALEAVKVYSNGFAGLFVEKKRISLQVWSKHWLSSSAFTLKQMAALFTQFPTVFVMSQHTV